MILVTGGAGNVGSAVARHLLASGEKVRILTRNPPERSFPDDAEVVPGDFSRPETLAPALSGVERAFLFPASTGVDTFLEAARKAGLQHVVLLSSSTVTSGAPGFVGERHQRIEQAVAASGLSWAFVRPGAFMTNDLAWAPQIVDGEIVRGVHGNAATAPIDPRDIGAVVVRALLGPRPGEVYTLTGPQSLTQIERVQIIAETIGRPLRFEEVPRAQFAEQMSRQGMLAPVIDQLIDGLAARDGKTAEVLPTVEEALGRPAFAYAQWAAHRSAAFRLTVK